MLKNQNQKESLYHTALIYLEKTIRNSPRISPGLMSSDKNLRKALQEKGSFEEIFKSYSPFSINELLERSNLKNTLKTLENITFDFQTLTINDKEFPEELRKDSEATPVIYTRGNTDLFNEKTIAVVGTRKLEDIIDINEGEKILQRLINKNYTIVSGLAEGCDTLAHKYTIKNKGKTIAVIGTPLNKYFPAKNKELQNKISENHLLISQYPIGTRTFPNHFAHRNRTTIDLSKEGAIIIHANDRSGTQHAIKQCINDGKELYVLKNNLNKGYFWTKKYFNNIKIL
tara:strand:+ start:204 stop:1061 length:858 start_codon:yes stop_codon:yes gene_type:complete